jgi:hypothetical protein
MGRDGDNECDDEDEHDVEANKKGRAPSGSGLMRLVAAV